MEDELLKWKEKVKQQRENFYELNYYTMKQLLTLRKELGKLISHDKHSEISPEVISLLQSVSTQVYPSVISDMVLKTTAEAKARLESEQREQALAETWEDDESETAAFDQDILSSTRLQVSEQSLLKSNTTTVKKPLKKSSTDITDEQQEMMSNIRSRLACSEELVLRSFRECPKGEQYDFERWCVEHLDDDDKEENDDSSDDYDTDEDADFSEDNSEQGGKQEFIHIPGRA